MTRIYLDNNIWNALAEDEAQCLLEHLYEAAGTSLSVIAAFPVLEEILSTSHSNTSKAELMTQLILDLSNGVWMREIAERIPLEVRGGGRLKDSHLLLPPMDLEKVISMAKDHEVALDIANSMHSMSSTFKKDEEQLRSLVSQGLGSAPGTEEMRTLLWEWLATEDASSWCMAAVSPDVAQLIEDRGVTPSHERTPSLWLFVRFKMARIMQCVGEGRRIQGSDLTDCRHYAGGAYFDAMVTKDQRFRETCGLLPETPFVVWTWEELTFRLSTMERPG